MPSKPTKRTASTDFANWPAAPIAALVFFFLAVLVLTLVLARPGGTVTAAIVAGSATVFGSSVSITIGRYLEKRRDLEHHIRNKSVPEYEKIVEFWFRVLFAGRDGAKKMSDQELTSAMRGFTQSLVLWGSDDVIRSWGRLRQRFMASGQSSPSEREALMFEFEEFLMVIRRDSGHDRTSLGRSDLLRLFINNLDDAGAATQGKVREERQAKV